MVIYLIRNRVNEKVYIGKTKRSLQARWTVHLKSAKRGDKQTLYAAIRKYGVESFDVCLLSGYAESIEDLNSQERYFIAKYQSYPPSLGFGYNMTAGGDGGPDCRGIKRSPETCEKIGNASRGRGLGIPKNSEHRNKIGMAQTGEKNHMFGKPSPNRGKKISKIAHEKIVEKAQKRWNSEDYRKKHRAGLEEWNKTRQGLALNTYLENPSRCKRCMAVILPKVLGKVKLSNVKIRQYCGGSCAASARQEARISKSRTGHKLSLVEKERLSDSTRNTVWVHGLAERKRVRLEELTDYLNKGWSMGQGTLKVKSVKI